MSEEHKMTKQDRLVLTITLAAIFFGVFGLGLIGLIFNLSSQILKFELLLSFKNFLTVSKVKFW